LQFKHLDKGEASSTNPDWTSYLGITLGEYRSNLRLATFVRLRRLALNLSCQDAAQEAKMRVRDWTAIEGGWFSSLDEVVLRAIAATLQTQLVHVRMLASNSKQAVLQEDGATMDATKNPQSPSAHFRRIHAPRT
jgi:hypothetical protein